MKLICYLSNGYPTIESCIRIADEYVAAGCDIIEVDFPSPNPFLEGEYIAGRMKEALKNCSDYEKYMDGIGQMKSHHPDTQYLIVIYEETIQNIGVERFIRFCIQNQIRDIIYVGGNNKAVKDALADRGIRISCYVQFHMAEEEIAAALSSNGFVYMQAKPTSNNVNPQFPTLKACIQELKRRGIRREIYAGVGIYTTDDIEMAKNSGADAVFVGSTILKLQNDIPQMKEKIAELKKACSG